MAYPQDQTSAAISRYVAPIVPAGEMADVAHFQSGEGRLAPDVAARRNAEFGYMAPGTFESHGNTRIPKIAAVVPRGATGGWTQEASAATQPQEPQAAAQPAEEKKAAVPQPPQNWMLTTEAMNRARARDDAERQRGYSAAINKYDASKPELRATGSRYDSRGYELSPESSARDYQNANVGDSHILTDYTSQAIPTWGKNEMETINAGIRARKAGGGYEQGAITGAEGVSSKMGVDRSGKPIVEYTGKSSDAGIAEQARIDAEQAAKGMVRDKYGNWAPEGGWAGRPELDTSNVVAMLKSGKAGRTWDEQQAASKLAKRQAAIQQGTPEERAAKLRKMGAEAGLAETQAEAAGFTVEDRRKTAEANRILEAAPGTYSPAVIARAKAHVEKALQDKIAFEQAKARARYEAENPPAEGYADGGAISARPQYGQAPAPNPLLAKYGQYLTAASQAGVAPVPFEHYVNLLDSTQGQMQATPPVGFAEGGEIEDVQVDGGQVRGGDGTTDSIPAVINGNRRAALDDGEFVIPAHVVRAKGTEFFDKLLAQYADKGESNGD